MPLSKALPSLSKKDKDELAKITAQKALQIIEAKGSTAFGIGSCVSTICSAILFDKDTVRPVTHYVDELGLCLSLPCIIGRRGVVRKLPCPLDEGEEAALQESAKSLREIIDNVRDEFEAAKKH